MTSTLHGLEFTCIFERTEMMAEVVLSASVRRSWPRNIAMSKP